MRAKVSKTLNLLLQVVIITIAYGFLYRELVSKMKAHELSGLLSRANDLAFILPFSLAFFMLFLNIGIEAAKWRFMIGKYEDVPFLSSFKAVLSGVTVSVFTPNRIGEYFGRVFILKKLHPFKGVLITFVGSMGQLLVTVITGSVAAMFFLPLILDQAVFPNNLITAGAVLAGLVILPLLVILYLNFPVISGVLQKMLPGSLREFDKYIVVFEDFSSAELARIFGLSFLRYLVFSIQFLLLLIAFEVCLPFHQYLIAVPLIFFIITIVPTIALFEPGIRGSVAVFVLGFFLSGDVWVLNPGLIGVVAATTVLWLINLALPAVAGTLFIFNLRFFKNKNGHL
jgi:uncharacterized membrane protein YbhN (UPF0104 family)